MQERISATGPALDGPRPARLHELPQVVELVNQVFCVATGRPPTMGQQFPQLFSPENLDNLFLYSDGRRPVAHAGLWMGAIHVPGARIPVAALGSVCTLPDFRGRGLADRLVRTALARCRAQGRPLLVISGDRSLYRRNGAHPAGRFRRLKLTTAQAGGAGAGSATDEGIFTLRPARIPDDLASAAALHQREPVRWHRPLADWSMLLEAAGFATIFRLRQELWLVEADGVPVAGWVAARGPALPGELMVLEAFGSRTALAWSLRLLLQRTGTERATLPLLEGDPLGPALRGVGWPVAAFPLEPLPGTVAVVDWPLLWRSLAPFLEERVPARWAHARARVEKAGDGAQTRYLLETEAGEGWAAPDEAALIRALFGARRDGDEDLLPPNHPLAGGLPVPLPWPQGLNYI